MPFSVRIFFNFSCIIYNVFTTNVCKFCAKFARKSQENCKTYLTYMNFFFLVLKINIDKALLKFIYICTDIDKLISKNPCQGLYDKKQIINLKNLNR
ncbi:hypothetical protein GCM10022217_19340 [Chryseobacterium ginsenosidimutans]